MGRISGAALARRRALALAKCRRVAKQRGGRCLSRAFVSTATHLRWSCREGHRWQARPAAVFAGTWCPSCAYDAKRLSLDDMRAIARERGGECLATSYTNERVPVRWRCAEGHVWIARSGNVRRAGSWCPECAWGSRLSLADVRRIARERGGECLSEETGDSRTKLRWRCAEGHEWSALLRNVKRGSWCRRCAHRGAKWRRLGIDDMWNTAADRGGRCVSTQYLGADVPLVWECANGHRWKASPGNVRHGSWCPTCATSAPGTIAAMRALARRRGGECLSTEYLNDKRLLEWRCAENHRFEYPALAVKSGAWCPTCSPPPRRRIIRLPPARDPAARAAERRPARTLVRAAARMVRHRQGAEEKLASLRAVARRRGGACLADRYLGALVKIAFRCGQDHEWETSPAVVANGSWCPACAAVARQEVIRNRKFAALKRLAQRRGGACLSTTYVNNVSPLRWRCARGHEWETSASYVDAGHWCTQCKRAERGGRMLERLRAVAKERGGDCLSTEHPGATKPLDWRCAEGHTWRATGYHVLGGTWCPRCRGTPRDDLARVQRIARRRGGRCLSIAYVNATTPLLFVCRKRHEWHAKPISIVRGRWCPECAPHAPGPMLSLHVMKQMAQERGGKCLSTTYHNALTYMRWQCARGHRWESRPADVRTGRWCRVCSRSFVGTIDGLRSHARTMGGKCLSTEYDDPRVPVRWQCAAGHRFERLVVAVKSGVWCPRCGTASARSRAT